MGARPKAQQVIAWLGLEPHRTGGQQLAQSFVAQAVTGGARYFLATPELGILLHWIRHDQVYHHYLFNPLELLLGSPAGEASLHRVENDFSAAKCTQLPIEVGTLHAGRLGEDGHLGLALLGTSVWG